MLDFPAADLVETNGICLAVHRAGPPPDEARATVLLLHGFPELAFSWRWQFPVLARAGYHLIAPDLRGFGGSDKPGGREAYRMDRIVADLAGLLDHDGIERAIVIGHDWGSLVVWSLPFYAPERLLGVASLNIPFQPRGKAPLTEAFRAVYGPDMYILRFQQEGLCEPILERDMDRTMRFFLRRPQPGSGAGGGAFSTPGLDLMSMLAGPEESWPGEPWLSAAEMAVYVEAFRKGGMTAPLHYYRNFDANWHDMARFQPPGSPPPRLDLPTLMITAGLDGVCPPRLADGMEAWLADYDRVDIAESGHWTQQEKPDEVNAALLGWLVRNFP